MKPKTCPVCGTARIVEVDQYAWWGVTGTKWSCLDCANTWHVPPLEGLAARVNPSAVCEDNGCDDGPITLPAPPRPTRDLMYCGECGRRCDKSTTYANRWMCGPCGRYTDEVA